MTIEQRVERLEVEHRWMRRGVTIAATVFGVVLLVSVATVCVTALLVTKEPQNLEVRSLTMRGASQQRIVLSVRSDGAPSLELVDEEGKGRASLELLNYGTPALFFRDEAGELRVSLTLAPNGVPTLTLRDEGGRRRASFSLGSDGTPSLALRDAEGETVFAAPR